MGFWKNLWDLLLAWIISKLSEALNPPVQEKYTVEYPEDYVRNFYQNGLTDYRWTPSYGEPLNHLYDNGERFKYRKQKYEYEA